MLNKKGMSPLLLTILLVAFAVALGAMIMSWGASKTINSQGTCDNVELVVQKAYNTDMICFNNETGKLKIIVKSTGKQQINSLIYRRITPDMSIRDTPLPSSEMNPGRIYEAEIPYQSGSRVHIEILPQIMIENIPSLCDSKAIIRENIPPCPK
ncbi:MAG: hypothetical protein ACP5N2_05685 [Candidatus Nanoarchaeia archaeon]